MSDRLPPAPKGSGASGKRLWRSVIEVYDLDEHELVILRRAVRTVDLLDALDEKIEQDGLTTVNQRGDVVAAPAVIEARQQAQVLMRLVAQLRLPDDQGHRGQHRGAPRGSYQRRAVGLHDVGALRVAS